MTDAEPVPITDATAPAYAIAAAIHDITRQRLPGHGPEIVRHRLLRPSSVIRASTAYSRARKSGKTERGAVRDAAIHLVRHYRVQHRL
ncbi:hypothetical protein AB5J52_48040 (plasmid) [Streptomyces sp. R39]|uniref:Uncharacterized protein n=1 Tax=Streptomyces sp. R39 TaxID=3238631 RepID=A0AB39R5N7_9ACTN